MIKCIDHVTRYMQYSLKRSHAGSGLQPEPLML